MNGSGSGIRIYVAGPIGKNDEGRIARVNAAFAAGTALMEAGLFPFVPHSSHYWDEFQPQHYETWMQYDFHWIEQCHALLRIPGESPGADREVDHAWDLGLPIFHTVDAVIEWAKRHDEISAIATIKTVTG